MRAKWSVDSSQSLSQLPENCNPTSRSMLASALTAIPVWGGGRMEKRSSVVVEYTDGAISSSDAAKQPVASAGEWVIFR